MTQDDKSITPHESNNEPTPMNNVYEQAMLLRYTGATHAEISKKVGVSLGTCRNWFSKSGVLAVRYEQFRALQKKQHEDSAKAVTEQAKQDAIQAYTNIKHMATTAESDGGRYKSNELILSMAGATPESSLRGILRLMSYDEAKKKVTHAFNDLYGRSLAPQSKPLTYEERMTIQKKMHDLGCCSFHKHSGKYCK